MSHKDHCATPYQAGAVGLTLRRLSGPLSTRQPGTLRNRRGPARAAKSVPASETIRRAPSAAASGAGTSPYSNAAPAQNTATPAITSGVAPSTQQPRYIGASYSGAQSYAGTPTITTGAAFGAGASPYSPTTSGSLGSTAPTISASSPPPARLIPVAPGTYQNSAGQLVDATGKPVSGSRPSISPYAAPVGALNSYGSSVADSAKSGAQQTATGFEQAQHANNPVQLLEGVTAMDAGAINTVTAPVAPLTKPISNAVNYTADKISNIPAVQNFANSLTGNTTARVTQDIANIDTIAGAVAPAGAGGISKLSSAEALNSAELAQHAAAAPASLGWGNSDSLVDHFAKHGADFSATSPTDYANKAQAFYNAANQNGYLTKVDSSGTMRIYDPSTNTFGSYNSDGTTKTLFKPTAGMSYWNSQPGQ